MEKIWKAHWPPHVREEAIRIPSDPLPVIFKRNARARPRQTALIFYGREVTLGELDEASDRFAGWLVARGLEPGDRVALFLENSPQFAIAYFGGLKAGGVNVCLNPMHKATELRRELLDAEARFLVTSEEGYAVFEPIRQDTPVAAVAATAYRDYLPDSPALPVPPSLQAAPQGHPGAEDLSEIARSWDRLWQPRPREVDDVALLQYTSGTTGAPKGAELTHGNLVSNLELQRVYHAIQPADVHLALLPWFHITGMECQLNLMAYLGGPLVVLARFDPETLLQAIQRYRCTMTTLITTVNVALVNHPRIKDYDLSSLQACFSGGAPVPAEIARRWEETTGYELVEGYGLSETTAPTHINPRHRPKYGTIGLPLPLTDCKLVDLEDGVTPVEPGEPGEIAVRGPMVMRGYWRRPEATAEVLRSDGFFRTGDVGRMDEEGYFRVVERKKDMIKASGFAVYPAEVESLMYTHPGVAEVGVVGVPHEYRGEQVVAFVVPRAGPGAPLSEQQLVEWCHGAMAAYKAPRRIWLVDSLPKTASGKVLRRALRDRAREATSGAD